jgi:hypothetical protein
MKTNTVDGALFTWRGNTGFAEVSDFAALRENAIEKVFGLNTFTVVSPKTGATIRFWEQGCTKDMEGDIFSFIFKSDDNKFVIELFND